MDSKFGRFATKRPHQKGFRHIKKHDCNIRAIPLLKPQFKSLVRTRTIITIKALFLWVVKTV